MTKINSIKTSNGSVHKIDEGIGFPSRKYVDLEWGPSGTVYTAPANGWFSVKGGLASNVNVYHDLFLLINGDTEEDCDYTVCSNINGTNARLHLLAPVAKGFTVKLMYPWADVVDGRRIRFIYAQGSESEE
jgi:hypothetical protein